jgi:hypothetical protein
MTRRPLRVLKRRARGHVISDTGDEFLLNEPVTKDDLRNSLLTEDDFRAMIWRPGED